MISTTINIFALVVKQGRAKFLEAGLAVAKALDLPVTSWRTGDPTISLYHQQAEVLDTVEDIVIEYARASNLTTAVEGDWLDLHAQDNYGVTPQAATYAAPTITLRNDGGGEYPLAIGDLTVKQSASGKTYHNTALGKTSLGVETLVLAPGVTLTFDLSADEAGSDSSVDADELDALVTTLEGVTIVSSTAGVARDKASPDQIKEQCRASLGALSPNGPPDAYEYVCRNSELTGSTEITRASADGDSVTGIVTVYVAGPAGAVTDTSVALAQRACELWATPLCITCQVVSATNYSIDIRAIVSGDNIPAGWDSTVRARLASMFQDLDIGADVQYSKIIATIHEAVPQIESVALVVPAASVVIPYNGVPVPGTFTLERV